MGRFFFFYNGINVLKKKHECEHSWQEIFQELVMDNNSDMYLKMMVFYPVVKILLLEVSMETW